MYIYCSKNQALPLNNIGNSFLNLHSKTRTFKFQKVISFICSYTQDTYKVLNVTVLFSHVETIFLFTITKKTKAVTHSK